VTIVSAVSATDSVAQKSATVSCPGRTNVIGTGASIGFAAQQVQITGVVPSSGTVTVYGSEDDTGYSGNWYVQATAICANAPSGYEIVSDSHVLTSDPSASAAAYCPGTKRMLGGAADVGIKNLGTSLPHNIPDVAVNQLLAGSTSEGMIAFAFEDGNGTAKQWILTAYAICANPITGLQRVYSWGTSLSDDTRYEVVTCPSDTRVLSAGGEVFPNTGEVSFTTLTPASYFGSEYVVVEAAEDQNGLSGLGYWRMDAWATCAPSVTSTPA
jgi:hypothetical protein